MKKILFLGLIFSTLFAEPTMYSDKIQKGDAVIVDLFGKPLGFKEQEWATLMQDKVCEFPGCATDEQVQCYRGFVDNHCGGIQRSIVKDKAAKFVGTCNAQKAAEASAGSKARPIMGPDGKPIEGVTVNEDGIVMGPDGKPIQGATVDKDGIVRDADGKSIGSIDPAVLALGVAGAAGVATLLATQGGDNTNPAATAAAASQIPGVIPGVNMGICQTPVAIQTEGARLKGLHQVQAATLPAGPAAGTANAQASHNAFYQSIVADLDTLANLNDLQAVQAALYQLFGKIAVLNGNGKLAGYFDGALAQDIVQAAQCIYNLGTVPGITAGATELANALR